MRKTIFVFVVSVILIMGLITPVFAANPTFEVSGICQKNSADTNAPVTGVNKGGYVTFVFSVKNFQNFANQSDGGKNGINVVKATLNYDENVFEPIEINVTELDHDNDPTTPTRKTFESIKTKVPDARGLLTEPAMEFLGNWSALVYAGKNDKGANVTKQLVVERSTFLNGEEEMVSITLKVKNDANVGESIVSLKEIHGSDQVKDVYVSNNNRTAPVSVVIKESIIIVGDYIRINNMPVSDFKNNSIIKNAGLDTSDIKNPSGTTLNADAYIPTGSKVTDGTKEYTVITVGDVNSDGKAGLTDFSRMKSLDVGLLTNADFTEDQRRAIDIKWDKKFTAVDMSHFQCYLVGLFDFDIVKFVGDSTLGCDPVGK